AEDGIRDFHVTGVQTCALPLTLNFFKSPSKISSAPILFSNLIVTSPTLLPSWVTNEGIMYLPSASFTPIILACHTVLSTQVKLPLKLFKRTYVATAIIASKMFGSW